MIQKLRLPQPGTKTLTQRLQDVPLFRGLSAGGLKRLAQAAVKRDIRPREALYEEGDPAASCFVLLGGAVQFNVRLGRQRVIAGLAFENDVFGLESLRPRSTRPDSATAARHAHILEFDTDTFRRFLIEHPRFQLELMGYVVSKLREKVTHAVQTGHYDAEQKIAAYLINGGSGPEARETRSLSQAELADYLSLTPETFCRKVSKFRQLGWIAGRGNEYTVKRRDALESLLER